MINLHGLVQKVTRVNLFKESTIKTINLLTEKFLETFIYENTNVETIKWLNAILPHAIILCEYAQEKSIDTENQSILLLRIASFLNAQKRQSDISEKFLYRALDIAKHAQNEDRNHIGNIYLNLFNVYCITKQLSKISQIPEEYKDPVTNAVELHNMSNLDAAEKLYLQTIVVDKKTNQPGASYHMALAYSNLSNLYIKKNSLSEAENALKEAEKIYIELRSDEDVLKIKYRLGELKSMQGETVASINYFQEYWCIKLSQLSNQIFNDQLIIESFIKKVKSKISIEEIIDFIIEHKGNIDATEEDKTTIFMMACSLNNFEAIEKLIKAGANKDARDRHATALHYAFINNTPKLLTYLLQQGCSVDVTDNDGDYPELWAVEKDFLENLQAALDFKKSDGSYLIDINRIQGSTYKNLLE
ncbi:MAG: ankyrin repeat domain-containing protein, partial [Gammaproteobacteria bacterium]